MNYGNQISDPDSNRRDIGSRIYWELIPRDYLYIIFHTLGLSKEILNNFTEIRGTHDWNKEYGFVVHASSRKIYVLATKREDRAALKQLFDSYSVARGITSIDSDQDYVDKINELNKEFVRNFAKLVSLCALSI